MTDSTPIITADQFRKYTLAWEELLSEANTDALTACFSPNGLGTGMSTGTFLPLDKLIRLVSTVGATRVSARFGLEITHNQSSRFVVLLYAAN